VGTFFMNTFDYNSTLWTIAFEFFGSFLIFGFLAFFGRMRNRYWAYIFVIIFFFQTFYLAFILGMLLSDLMAHNKLSISKFDKNKLIRTGMLLLRLFLASYASGRDVDGSIYALIDNHYFSEFDVFCHIIGAFLIIWVLLDSKKMQKIFSFKYFLFLGEISFSMYLLHFIILGSFSSFIFLNLAPHMSYLNASLLSFVLSVGVIFSLAYLMYLYVDKKAVHLAKLVYERMFK
jgi:peptidoglycan/LPS O-acetylase OafA/YrhL